MTKDEIAQLWKAYPHTLAHKLSRGKWIDYKHLKFISKQIAPAIVKGNARFIVEAPPRHGKSELISHWTPTWFLENFPTKSVIIASYESSLAQSFGRKVRNEFETQELLNTELAEDSKAANRFHTKQGGGFITAGVGGALTGKGGDLCIIDDPIKNKEEAYSANRKRIILDWADWVLKTRLEPNGSIVLLNTRWSHDDLSGAWLRAGGWTRIRMPALAEEDDILGREIGEPLCPERYPLDALLQIKSEQPANSWNALYQQRPNEESGALVKREHFKFWKALPGRFDQTIQSWDMTFKETSDGSFVVGQVWGKYKADLYLIDQVRARTEFIGAQNMVKAMHGKHPIAAPIIIEDKANGPAIISSLNREIAGIVPWDVKGSKYARFEAVSPMFVAGNVFIPDPSTTPWVNDFIEELVTFPFGSHDDQVDATSQAIDYLRDKVQPFTENMIPRRITSISKRGERISW